MGREVAAEGSGMCGNSVKFEKILESFLEFRHFKGERG